MIKWTMVTDGLPSIEDKVLGKSFMTLCLDSFGTAYLGYVQYYDDEKEKVVTILTL